MDGGKFKDILSHKNCMVICETVDRTYSKRTSAMEGLTSVFGIVMATSNCPAPTCLRGGRMPDAGAARRDVNRFPKRWGMQCLVLILLMATGCATPVASYPEPTPLTALDGLVNSPCNS